MIVVAAETRNRMVLDRKIAGSALRAIAQLAELHGGNPHRVRAFANAARAVERLEGDLAGMVASGAILTVPGIGKGTAAVLADLAAGREPEALAELERATPPGVRELLEIAGLGPKRARTLWQELSITSVGELEYACRENRLLGLPGFGEASQQRLLEAVRFHQSSRERRLVHQAWEAAEELRGRLAAAPGVGRLEVAGELRRGCETVAAVDLVADGDHELVGQALRALLSAVQPMPSGGWTGSTAAGVPVRVWTTVAERAAWTLVEATGSDAHLEALRRRATAAGIRIADGRLWSGRDALAVADEPQLYAALGCQWVPPELREDGAEVEAAADRRLPVLVEPGDLRGALHNHTVDSDGTAPVEAMARAAGELGWEYIGIADHSPAAHYANGLSADRLAAQWRVIDGFNARGGPRLVKGIEADILPDGGLDLPAGCEAGLEYVVASVHSSFRMAAEAQTERILSAVRHPACRVLGHPTGRLLLARPGYELNLERVLEACAERGVAVEINASPYRLDLDAVWARRAIELGVLLAVNPDAHSTEALADLRWGVAVARRAGAEARHLVNCGDLEGWLARR
jgi:DNA polymerase (family 10)